MSNYNDKILNIFRSIRGIDGREFGRNSKWFYGLSDDAKGVQWSIAVSKENRDTRPRLVVNLEGITYQDWPIAKFIENEKNEMRLCNLKNLPQANEIFIGFYRDAWQCAFNPDIKEYSILNEISLLKLDKNTYSSALNEAYNCLNAKNHRGRAKQRVTRNNEPVEMEVSPHLNIHMCLPYNSSKEEMKKIFAILQPVYDLVKNQSV